MLPFQAISFTTTEPGKRLIVTGAVHGNEVAGTHGIRRVAAEFAAGSLAACSGSSGSWNAWRADRRSGEIRNGAGTGRGGSQRGWRVRQL